MIGSRVPSTQTVLDMLLSIAVALLQIVQGVRQRQRFLMLRQLSQARLLRQGEEPRRLQIQLLQRQGQLPQSKGQLHLPQGQSPLSLQTLLMLKTHWVSMLTPEPQPRLPSHKKLVQQHQQGQEQMHLLMKGTPSWTRWNHVCMAWSSSCSSWRCRNLVRLTAAVKTHSAKAILLTDLGSQELPVWT